MGMDKTLGIDERRLLSGGSNSHNRPTAAARRFPKPAIWATAVLRNLPSGLFTQIGHSRPWVSGQARAAIRRIPAVQPLTAVNDRLSLQATAGPEPELLYAVSDDLWQLTE